MEKEVAKVFNNTVALSGVITEVDGAPYYNVCISDGESYGFTESELVHLRALLNNSLDQVIDKTEEELEKLKGIKKGLKTLSKEVFTLLADPKIFELLTNQGNDYKSTLTQLHSLVQTNPACNGLVGDSKDLALALVNEYIGVDVGTGFYGTVEFLTHDFGKGKRVVISTRMELDNLDEINMKELEHWEMLHTMYRDYLINLQHTPS